MEVRISGASRTDQYILEFQQKTWHFSLIVTILSVVATYFTVAELKKVHSSLEQLHEAGQTETHGKRLSLITNCLICIWNMCYAISFFVSAMYFKPMFVYFAVPAFWFFMLSFVFLSRMLIFIKAI